MNFNDLIKRSKAEYKFLYESQTPVITVGSATCGNSAGALTVKSIIEEELDKNQIEYELITVGCIGLCYAEPIITITKKDKPTIFYGNVTIDLARKLVNSYILGYDPLAEYALGTVGEGSIEGIPAGQENSAQLRIHRPYQYKSLSCKRRIFRIF